MNKEDYVSFEIAKLLKETGYPQETSLWSYLADGKMTCTYDERDCYCDAPHLWDALKWLREEKETHVAIIATYISGFYYTIESLKLWRKIENSWLLDLKYPTYEQACEAGIAAACEWLIGKYYYDAGAKAACEWLIAHGANDESKSE